MSNLKKIGALVLTVMMIAVVGLAFAAGDAENGDVIVDGIAGNSAGIWTDKDTPVTQGTTLKFYKEITAYNPETCVVNAPAVTYAYSIVAGDADKIITDDKLNHDTNVNVQVKTKAGVGSPTITGFTLVPGTNTLKASKFGTANWFDITVSFNGIDFLTSPGTGAGVYRYVITETTAIAEKNASGIKDGNSEANDKLYLDVYVDGTGAIYGYVLFKNNGNIDATTNAAAAATAAGKVEGFVDSNNETVYSSDTSTADKYYTFSFELKKVVTGDNYSISTKHKFPFHVTLDNPTVTANVLPIMTVGTDAEQTALTAGKIGTSTSATTWEPKIAHNATVKYVGIPCGTTVTIYETNDVIGVTYKSSSTNADTDAAVKSINYEVDSSTATINCNATALKAAEKNHTSTASSHDVIFTNDLQEISPTGYVARFAPYVLILIAGIALLIVAKKRKPASEEE